MKAEELLQLVHHKPFQPFRIHLRDGRSFEVRYPHLAMVGVRFFDLGMPIPGDPDPFICDRVESLNLSDIVRVEMIEPPAEAKNGSGHVPAEELYQLVQRKPFRPFRIYLRDGRTFDVRYPHLTLVGEPFFVLGIPSPDDPDPLYYDYVEILDVTYIERAEDLEPTSNSEPK